MTHTIQSGPPSYSCLHTGEPESPVAAQYARLDVSVVLALKAWRIPGDLWIFSTHWKVGQADDSQGWQREQQKRVILLQRVKTGKQAKCIHWTSWDRLDATAVTA